MSAKQGSRGRAAARASRFCRARAARDPGTACARAGAEASAAPAAPSGAGTARDPAQKGVRVRFKIRELPLPVRAALEEKMRTDYRSARHTSRWLLEVHHHYISPQSIARYKRDTDTALGAVSSCVVQAQAILKAAGKDQGKVNYALAALVQTSVFELLVALRTAQLSLSHAARARRRAEAIRVNRLEREGKRADGDEQLAKVRAELNKAEAQAIHIVARTIELMGKLIAEFEKTQRERLEARRARKGGRKGAAAVPEGGLSPEAEASIRAVLLDVGPSLYENKMLPAEAVLS